MLEHQERHACLAHRAAPDGFALPGAEKHYPPDLELEPTHLELALDLEAQSARGEVIHTVLARRAGAPALTLHGVSLEEVDVRDADGRALRWRYDGRELEIRWADDFAIGEARRVAVRYAVREPVTGLLFSKPLPLHPEEPWFAATDSETERARHWMPCVDLPSARPTLDFHLRADERFTILANGRLVGEERHGDGTKTAHWKLEAPCPSYITCFAVGDFFRVDDGEHVDADGARVPVAYFATKAFHAADLRRSFERTRPMLAWMTRKLERPFPFPKYFQLALPRIGGAMENVSLVSWDDAFVLDEALASEWSRLVDQVNVHEMAHSYFGDLVVIRDFAHAWLKESWATYLEQCWFEDEVSLDEARYEYVMNAAAYFDEADGRYRRPLVLREYSSSFDLYDRHLYPGGACRLHTLRHELGDGAFWEGTRLYLRRHAHGVVETDDFRRAMEEASGRSLGRFFDQWFHAPGYPALKVAFRHDAERHEGIFEIEQTQVDAAAGVGVFELPLPLEWTLDGETHRTVAKLRRAKETVVVEMRAEPEVVRVDPEQTVLHKLDFNPGDALLRRQLARAKDVVGRIHAAEALCKSGSRPNLEAVAHAYAREKFWGARVEMARALATEGSELALRSLSEVIAHEESPPVLAPLFRAAGAHRHEGIRGALLARVKAGHLPPRALAAAYEGLGAQRADAPYELLAKAARRRSFGGIAQSGALRALAASRHEEAAAALRAACREGSTDDRARPAAVGALGELGRLAAKRERADAVELCVELLRDPINRVRDAAVPALRAMTATEAVAALEAHGRRLARQHEVGVQRAVAAIQKDAGAKAKGAEKELELLRERLRKAEDAIRALEAKAEKQGAKRHGTKHRGKTSSKKPARRR